MLHSLPKHTPCLKPAGLMFSVGGRGMPCRTGGSASLGVLHVHSNSTHASSCGTHTRLGRMLSTQANHPGASPCCPAVRLSRLVSSHQLLWVALLNAAAWSCWYVFFPGEWLERATPSMAPGMPTHPPPLQGPHLVGQPRCALARRRRDPYLRHRVWLRAVPLEGAAGGVSDPFRLLPRY